jgi:hypothetical protein
MGRERDLVQLALDLEREGLEVVRRPGPHRRRRRPARDFDLGEGNRAALDWICSPSLSAHVRIGASSLERSHLDRTRAIDTWLELGC